MMGVIWFVLIGVGATAWNIVGLELIAEGVFRALAGGRMRRGGPGPSFMSPPVTERERIEVGDAGIVSGCLKALVGTAMLGLTTVLAFQDWRLWGETFSLVGESSSPYLDILGLFFTSTTAGATYMVIILERDRHLPRKELRRSRTRAAAPRPPVAPSRKVGSLLVAVGTLLCAICVVPCLYVTVEVFFFTPPPYIEIVPLVVGLSGPVYVAGLNLIRRGRRHFVRILSDLRDMENDSFILYLRWFEEDSFLDRAYPRMGSPLLLHFAISGASEEERLAEVLKPYGRLVAAGDPTEDLPRVGADRFYLPFEGWQGSVRELISKAKLVVLSLGMGEGTLWELVEAMSVLPPERLILLVPMNEEEYEAFRREAHKRLRDRASKVRATGGSWTPPVLPEYRGDPRMRHSDLADVYRDVLKRTASDSLAGTVVDGWRSGLKFALNAEARSVFRAAIHYPHATGKSDWGEPVFSRLGAEVPGWAPAFLRDPRHVALKRSLTPALDHAFPSAARGRPGKGRDGRSEPPDPPAARWVFLLAFPLSLVVFAIWGPAWAAAMTVVAAILYLWLTRKKPDGHEPPGDSEAEGG
ncbi:hypothetical protein FH608_037080 [Nonomuraea phyllanthi]|uniref:Uncharacterized protein n=1 Tax=Nonomuraea phyllanthi TaxID=2219224 RepID=A0A5C4VTB7_9ACTN|nr:hypothetical protein [Nonomuraea phyllanthi]KAB8190068.1 hypothetical protein FH608_037080 [Nonomuraea phyllanthi]